MRYFLYVPPRFIQKLCNANDNLVKKKLRCIAIGQRERERQTKFEPGVSKSMTYIQAYGVRFLALHSDFKVSFN